MVTTHSRTYTPGNGTGFDPEEIKRTVAAARASGLLRGPEDQKAQPIEKPKEVVAVQGKVTSGWMDVCQAKAKLWLENNFRNRPVSDDVVAAYARDMTNGVWVATHQGIAFNDKDELIDGQHRLLAIVRSGKTVRMMVTFGLPSVIAGKEMTTMDAVDRGRTRSVSDQLKIQHGMKDGSIIAAICSGIATLCNDERTRRLSVGQTLEIFRAYELAVKWVIEHRSKEHGLNAKGCLSAFAFAITAAQPKSDRITAMFEALVSVKGCKPKTAVAALRRFLVSDDAKLLTRGTDRGLAELVLEAIRLELSGVAVSEITLSLDGVNHFRKMQAKRVAKIAEMFRLPEAKQ